MYALVADKYSIGNRGRTLSVRASHSREQPANVAGEVTHSWPAGVTAWRSCGQTPIPFPLPSTVELLADPHLWYSIPTGRRDEKNPKRRLSNGLRGLQRRGPSPLTQGRRRCPSTDTGRLGEGPSDAAELTGAKRFLTTCGGNREGISDRLFLGTTSGIVPLGLPPLIRHERSGLLQEAQHGKVTWAACLLRRSRVTVMTGRRPFRGHQDARPLSEERPFTAEEPRGRCSTLVVVAHQVRQVLVGFLDSRMAA